VATWNFVTNYGLVLCLVAQYPQITAREIAGQLGITERTVLRIISDLEAEGYLRKSREGQVRDGRVNVYEVNHELPLRHYQLRDIAVGDLLKVLSSMTGGDGASSKSTNY